VLLMAFFGSCPENIHFITKVSTYSYQSSDWRLLDVAGCPKLLDPVGSHDCTWYTPRKVLSAHTFEPFSLAEGERTPRKTDWVDIRKPISMSKTDSQVSRTDLKETAFQMQQIASTGLLSQSNTSPFLLFLITSNTSPLFSSSLYNSSPSNSSPSVGTSVCRALPILNTRSSSSKAVLVRSQLTLRHDEDLRVFNTVELGQM
jgi:hypothetical protein